MSSKKTTRPKLLLDEGLPPKDRFPNLNNLHTVKHMKIDLKLCKLLKNLKPSQKDGHLFSVTNEGINIKKITEQD